MTRVRLFVCVLVCAMLGGGWLAGQDDKPKLKGTLPANWGKLGLSKDQIQKVYTVQAEFRSKLAVLEGQLKKLRDQQQTEMEKVLTPEQKAQLRDIITKKAPDDPKKKPGDKPGDKKPGGDK